MSVLYVAWSTWTLAMPDGSTFISLVYICGFLSVLFSFLASCLMDPGRVVLELGDQEPLCKYCQVFKPPRAHHCRTCDKCILRMDHHCIWIGNCVGFKNLGHFTRFLLQSSLCVWFSFYLTIHRIVTGVNMSGPLMGPSLPTLVFISFNIVILTPLSVILPMMTWNQMSLILQNLTTIESLSLESEYALERDVINPYDLGSWHRHLEQSLGGLLGLFVPLNPKGNGRVFPTMTNAKKA